MAKKEEGKEAYHMQVRLKEERKIRKLKQGKRNALAGFGLFGLVGWSVVIPTVIGLIIGIYIDKHHPSRYSWSLMFLVLGVCVGCLQAWYWVQRERERIERDKEGKNGP